MENDDTATGEQFVASIENLPLLEQNRLLREQVAYIEKLNERDLREIKKIKVDPINQKASDVEIDNIDLDHIRRKNEEAHLDLRETCNKKMSEAGELAVFCINHYENERKRKVEELDLRRIKIERMNEMVHARLNAIDDLYEMKTKQIERAIRKKRTQNYFHYQMISDEMYRRMGRDTGESKTYSHHIKQKKRLVRSIIRHNQDLMNTDEGKSSTSSSSTASIVEALRRDVDRLEHIVDKNCDQIFEKESTSFLSSCVFNDDKTVDNFFIPMAEKEYPEDETLDMNAIATFSSVQYDDYLNNKNNHVDENHCDYGENRNSSSTISSSKIVNGDDLSLSDFSI